MFQDPDRTVLLFDANIRQFRQTIEELPVGCITVKRNGIIKAIDAWTEQLLGYTAGELQEESISTIFGDYTEVLLEALKRAKVGYIGGCMIATRSGLKLKAQVVMAEGMEAHLFRFQIIYTIES